MLDVLMIHGSKLYESFPVAQFTLNGFNLYRQDHTEHSGGIMWYIRKDHRQRERCDLPVGSQDIKSGRVESLENIDQIHSRDNQLCDLWRHEYL